MQELFDIPEQYEAMLKKGIGLTGNDKSFFVRGRLDLVQSNLPVPFDPEMILDFGCGTGETAVAFRKRFPKAEIWGTDPAVPALRWAEKQHEAFGISFRSLEETNGKSFDLIYLNCVLHHVKPAERLKVCQQIRALAHDHSEVWIFENNPANPGTQYAMWANPFDKGVEKIWPGGLQKLLETTGFEVVSKHFLFYFPEWLSWFRPLEPLLEKVPLGGQYGFRLRPV